MKELRLDENHLLFGSDQTRGIVAAELAGRFIRLFIRDEDGVKFRDDPFHPFILLETTELLAGFPGEFTLRHLNGEGEYRFIAFFRDWRDCLAARDHLAKRSGKGQSAQDAPYLYLSDPVHQHLLITGKTLFKGLDFTSLKRLALDIETYCAAGYEFSNPERPEDRIISIAVMDESGYGEVLFGHDMAEEEMLARLTSIIREKDPDVIEGHNIFRFDLEYIRKRAALHKVRLPWGRDGSEPRVHSSRFTIAERIIEYPRWDIYGRHIIDTYFLLQIYDISARELESYGLKAAAIHFGLAVPDRVYLDRERMGRAYTEEPESLKQYNLDDARETLALSRLLSYSWFLETRMFPYSYQNCLLRGNATKINSLFLREYLRLGVAIPRPATGGSFEGGYNHVFINGVVGPIVHCDVTSLYPSLMLAYGIAPARERLGLFLPLLRQLRDFRLAAKQHARSESDPGRRDYYQALQQAFKVLINSFYGYLGTTIHNFSDTPLAAEVTRLGRETIQGMLAWLEMKGARPVEVDTDGIYFIPPTGVASEDQEESLVRELSASLPAGIDVELAGRYRAIFSYKMKNYALLGHDGRIIVKGSGLKSRGMEKYLREFMQEMIKLLLQGDEESVEDLYLSYLERLKKHRFPISSLAKTETLGESPASYRIKVKQGKRNPAAAFEIAISSGHEYRAGDQISYYVAGQGREVTAYRSCRPVTAYDPARPDENVAYYCDKLTHLKKKFEQFLSREMSLFD
jgi:DNA polymerase I